MNPTSTDKTNPPPSCPKCGSADTRRSPRKTWERQIQGLISLKAYRCNACHKRFVRKG